MTRVTALSVKDARAKYLSELPARLQQLNKDLAIDRARDFDYLYATRGEHRFKVCVFRADRVGFVATTKVGGRVHRYQGQLPCDAFIGLTKSLSWIVARLDFEKNMAIAAVK